MGLVATISTLLGFTYWWLGAWPVIGFFGIDVALVWLGFRWAFRKDSIVERITITESNLLFERYTGEKLAETLSFSRSFVQIVLEHDLERNIIGTLALGSRGKFHQFGAFLGAEERQAVAKILRSKLKERAR